MYTYHIPNSIDDMSVITPARFVLLMAAFEWEYKCIYNKKPYLKKRIIKAFTDNMDVLERFMKILYGINGLTYTIDEIAENLKNHRNNYAHGDISGIFVDKVVLDLLALEWLLYSMRLKHIGFDTDKIKIIINELFKRNVAL